MCIYVHVIRDRCHTIPFSGSKQHWDTSALHMFVPNYDLSHCDWNWILWYFSLAISIESMVLDGLVAQRDLGSFGIASTPPTLDLTFRYGFTILREFPLHNTCKEWWPWERSQGSQMCWESNLFWFIPGSVHQTNGWRHISMQVNGKLGYVLVFFLISSAARFMETWCYQTTAELLNS